MASAMCFGWIGTHLTGGHLRVAANFETLMSLPGLNGCGLAAQALPGNLLGTSEPLLRMGVSFALSISMTSALRIGILSAWPSR